MHAQAKSDTSASPPDLAAFLAFLNSEALEWHERINIEGITGSGIEDGGKVALAIEDGRLQEAHDRLTGENYTLEWTNDLYHEVLPAAPNPNRPGTLLGVIQNAKAKNPGRAIDSVLIGQRTQGGRQFFVQVTFVDSTWTAQPPAEEFDEHDHDGD